MKTYYRIVSNIPLDRPKMVIGAPVANHGYTVRYSDFVGSLRKAKALKRELAAQHTFGQHTIQAVQIESGVKVLVEGKVVTMPEEKGAVRRGCQ